ncbi:MAG: phospholipase D-like domain-containing protein, partial [Ignavibacteriaceae bacterium]
AFLSTGNFNEKTAKIYCDVGFFTSKKELTSELEKIFDYLSKRILSPEFKNLLVAPFNLRDTFTNLINNEIRNAKEGKDASIILKLNSIEDKKIIKKLYEASNAGVKIKIIVRGICCLIPGVKNMSENIKVISIVDRFLEHSRIYIFYNGGTKKYFVSSADWMTRNLDRRIELAFPVYDENIQEELHDIINIQLSDNIKARKINRTQNNPYKRSKSKLQIRAQYEIYKYLKKRNKVSESVEKIF